MESETRFLKSLPLAAQPRARLCAVNHGWIHRVEAIQAARLTGRFVVATTPDTTAARRAALGDHDRIQKEIMTITVQVSDALLEDLAASPEELDREIRLAASIHLYSNGLVSQGQGAEIAGLSRWDFIQALGRAEVPACQVTSEELTEDVERASQPHRQRVAAHPPDEDRAD